MFNVEEAARKGKRFARHFWDENREAGTGERKELEFWNKLEKEIGETFTG